jgi:hypothetical protein
MNRTMMHGSTDVKGNLQSTEFLRVTRQVFYVASQSVSKASFNFKDITLNITVAVTYIIKHNLYYWSNVPNYYISGNTTQKKSKICNWKCHV